MMSQRWAPDRNHVLWHPETPGVWNNTTEIPEQKQTTSWTPNDQATDKSPVPANFIDSTTFMLGLSLSLIYDQLACN